jgi:hypothetical protein
MIVVIYQHTERDTETTKIKESFCINKSNSLGVKIVRKNKEKQHKQQQQVISVKNR